MKIQHSIWAEVHCFLLVNHSFLRLSFNPLLPNLNLVVLQRRLLQKL
jgi:hypothetical protein